MAVAFHKYMALFKQEDSPKNPKLNYRWKKKVYGFKFLALIFLRVTFRAFWMLRD